MTTKTEAASEVRKILQSVKDRLAQPGGAKVNEATTRAHFITPLLGALGYHSIDDVLFEVYLPDGKTFLDYRLVVGGKPRVAVEAKALDVHVADKDAAQAVQYASLLGDPWSVVTNARTWRLYETFAQVPLAEKHILTVDLVGWTTDAEFDAVFEQLWLTSRESFETDNGPASWLTTKKLEALLRKRADRPGIGRSQVHPEAARGTRCLGHRRAGRVMAQSATRFRGSDTAGHHPHTGVLSAFKSSPGVRGLRADPGCRRARGSGGPLADPCWRSQRRSGD